MIATLCDPQGDIPVTVKDNLDGTYTCTYVPRTANKVKLDVKLKTIAFGTGDVQGAPFSVSVAPGAPSASYTFAEGPGLSNATAGLRTPVKVFLRDEFSNTLTLGGVPITGQLKSQETGEVVPVSVVDNGNGTFDLSYDIEKAGEYELNIKLDGKLIKDAPFKIEVDPGISSVDNAEVSWLGNPTAGLTGGTIQLRDQFMNLQFKGGDSVVAEFKSKTPSNVTAFDKGDGTYDISYPFGAKGKHSVDVRLNGNTVPGSPWEVDVQESPLDEESKKKVDLLLPRSSFIMHRLLLKASPNERNALLKELAAVKKV